MAWRKFFIIIGWRRHSSRRLKNSPVGPSGFAIGGSIPSLFSSLDRSSSVLQIIARCHRTTTDKRFPLSGILGLGVSFTLEYWAKMGRLFTDKKSTRLKCYSTKIKKEYDVPKQSIKVCYLYLKTWEMPFLLIVIATVNDYLRFNQHIFLYKPKEYWSLHHLSYDIMNSCKMYTSTVPLPFFLCPFFPFKFDSWNLPSCHLNTFMVTCYV